MLLQQQIDAAIASRAPATIELSGTRANVSDEWIAASGSWFPPSARALPLAPGLDVVLRSRVACFAAYIAGG